MPSNSDQRVAEAAALRDLFQEQWLQLRKKIKLYELRRLRSKQEQVNLKQAVEQIVDGTDSRLRVIGSYQKRLRHSARFLLNYLDEALNALSPVIDIERVAFGRDPLINTIFSSHKQILSLISQSPLIYDFFDSTDHQEEDHVFALLMAGRKDQDIFGSRIEGELIVRNVEKTAVQIHGHRIIAVGHSKNQMRIALKKTVFDGIIGYLCNYMTRLRHGQLTMAEREGLPGKGRGVDNPWVYLEVLEWLLSLPQDLISIQSDRLHIDNIGIKLSMDSEAGGKRLSLNEFTIGNNPPQIIYMIRFPRCELPKPATLEFPSVI